MRIWPVFTPLTALGVVWYVTALHLSLFCTNFTRWKAHDSRYIIFVWLLKMEHKCKLMLILTNPDLKMRIQGMESGVKWKVAWLHNISLFQRTLQTHNLSKRCPYLPVIGVCFKNLNACLVLLFQLSIFIPSLFIT